MPDTFDQVQWAQSHGCGVRSWAYYGIGKVHYRDPGTVRTLCGVKIPKPSVLFATVDKEEEAICKRCKRIAE